MSEETLEELANGQQRFYFLGKAEEIFEVPLDWDKKPLILLPDGKVILPIPRFAEGSTFMTESYEVVVESEGVELPLEELRRIAEEEGYTLATLVEDM